MDQLEQQKIEDLLGYHFNDSGKLVRALTHPTYSKEAKDHGNSFRDQSVYATLGDAVLKLGFTQILIEKGLKTKGAITDSKKDLEDNFHLAYVGERLQLLEEIFIFHWAGEGEDLKKASKAVRSDTVEALFGAIYLDSGNTMSTINESIKRVFALELGELEKKYPQ
jgi:dsRNA-specific ribonuclease